MRYKSSDLTSLVIPKYDITNNFIFRYIVLKPQHAKNKVWMDLRSIQRKILYSPKRKDN